MIGCVGSHVGWESVQVVRMTLNGVVRLDRHQSYRVKCHGKLRSPQITSRSTVSIPRVARSEPNSSKNIDLL